MTDEYRTLFPLYQVRTQFAVGGVVTDRDGKVIRCAPVLRKWCAGRHIDEIRKLASERGWSLELVDGAYD